MQRRAYHPGRHLCRLGHGSAADDAVFGSTTDERAYGTLGWRFSTRNCRNAWRSLAHAVCHLLTAYAKVPLMFNFRGCVGEARPIHPTAVGA